LVYFYTRIFYYTFPSGSQNGRDSITEVEKLNRSFKVLKLKRNCELRTLNIFYKISFHHFFIVKKKRFLSYYTKKCKNYSFLPRQFSIFKTSLFCFLLFFLLCSLSSAPSVKKLGKFFFAIKQKGVNVSFLFYLFYSSKSFISKFYKNNIFG